MKLFFKCIGILLLVLIVVAGIYYYANNESLPKGKQGKEADALGIKICNALNYDAFKSTEILEWSFSGKHFYKWYKQENIVEISWQNKKVILYTNAPEKSEVYIDGKKVEHAGILKNATDFFNNDSFWLVAPYKIFDTGTERRMVHYNGKNALLITYTTGGSTPGDSYLWILDNNYFPTSFKMWTKIIPIGGVSATWSPFKEAASGIKLPTKHKLSLFGITLDMGAVKAYNE